MRRVPCARIRPSMQHTSRSILRALSVELGWEPHRDPVLREISKEMRMHRRIPRVQASKGQPSESRQGPSNLPMPRPGLHIPGNSQLLNMGHASTSGNQGRWKGSYGYLEPRAALGVSCCKGSQRLKGQLVPRGALLTGSGLPELNSASPYNRSC